MAAYIDLASAMSDAELLEKCKVAILIAANSVAEAMGSSGPMDTANHRLWARYALDRPQDEAKKALNLIIAKFNGQVIGNITGASDSTIQTQVNAVLPYLVQSRADR